MPMNSMGLIMFPKVTELLYKRRVQPQSPPDLSNHYHYLSSISITYGESRLFQNSNKYQGLMIVNDLIIPSNEMGSMIVMRSSLRLLFIKEVHL